jgi:hypothetical protein
VTLVLQKRCKVKVQSCSIQRLASWHAGQTACCQGG